jgi:hypothetical protein
MLSNTSKRKKTAAADNFQVTGSLSPVVFITIDPALESVAVDSPLSAKAEAAKKCLNQLNISCF